MFEALAARWAELAVRSLDRSFCNPRRQFETCNSDAVLVDGLITNFAVAP